jgi:uncharacterized membrane protein
MITISWWELALVLLGANFAYGFLKGAFLHFWKKREGGKA